MMTAPAARSLATSQESCAATPASSRYERTPQLVDAPARSKQSFTEMGNPHSAPRPSPNGPPSPRGTAPTRAASASVHARFCHK